MERTTEMKVRKTLPVLEDVLVAVISGPTNTKFQTEEDFFKEVTQNVRDRASGKRLAPITTISFASVEALVAVLSPKRTELLTAVRKQGGFSSIESLSERLGRDRAGVSKDLKALNQAGLLNMNEAIHAGHGKRIEIMPTAEKMRLELVI